MITIGEMVVYVLSAEDAERVNRRRTSGESIGERVRSGSWPLGAQAHIGEGVEEFEAFPALVVAAYGDALTGEGEEVNLKVFLDGTDELWVQGPKEDAGKAPA